MFVSFLIFFKFYFIIPQLLKERHKGVWIWMGTEMGKKLGGVGGGKTVINLFSIKGKGKSRNKAFLIVCSDNSIFA